MSGSDGQAGPCMGQGIGRCMGEVHGCGAWVLGWWVGGGESFIQQGLEKHTKHTRKKDVKMPKRFFLPPNHRMVCQAPVHWSKYTTDQFGKWAHCLLHCRPLTQVLLCVGVKLQILTRIDCLIYL